MKLLVLLMIAVWGTLPAVCAPPASLQPTNTNCEVVWSAGTNDWPEMLWNYKTHPQRFSPEVISNLLAATGLAESNRCGSFGDNGISDKSALRFKSADDSKRLGIYPSLGFIEFRDTKATAVNQFQRVEHLPTPPEVTRMGTALIQKLGIDLNELAKKPGSSDLELHWEKETIDFTEGGKQGGKTLTNMCGVFFLRQVNGIRFKGIGLNGGAEIAFGNDAKVSLLRVSWRKITPYKRLKTIQPNEILQDITNGKIHFPAKAKECGEIKRITFTSALLLYDASFGDERQDYIVPIVRLQAKIVGTLKETNLLLELPIFASSK